MRQAVLAFAILLVPAAAAAQDPLAPLEETGEPQPQPAEPLSSPLPASPPPPPVAAPVRVPANWQEVFAAIRGGRWAEAEAGIAALPQSPLSAVARAELFTARGSPPVALERIRTLLQEAPELPQAEQLARLAASRGATTPLAYYRARSLSWLGNAPTRSRARPVAGESAADQLRAALDPLIRSDTAAEAETLLMQAVPNLSFEARAEAGQRVAWSYYSAGRDADARRVADTYRLGATGDWAVQSAWVSGLASWRLGDCNGAARAFREVAAGTRERELSAGAHFWAARAEQACRRPQAVEPLLRAAARSPESFYGLLARERLGMDTRLGPDPNSHAANVRHLPNVQRAVELARIGERWLAEEMLRHQARIGNPGEHHGLIEFAKQLDLAGAQYWLAHNGQPGAIADAHDRYPLPRWTPLNGWRIDPALAFAHIRQESQFRADVISPAGAVGLMQVMPGTASDLARAAGQPGARPNLADPMLNMEFGQSFLEKVRSNAYTQGQLPKVIAAYNAGPLPVGRWAWLDRGDPLLWIESIPYWETRFYVPAVMRNYWIYQGLRGAERTTLKELSQNRWPYFPSAGQIASRD